MYLFKIIPALIFLLTITSQILLAGPKTDTIYFQNGNKLTCEFKKLQNNLLNVSTSDAGTLDIKWDKIDSLYIKQFLVIEMNTGERITGSIFPIDTIGFDGVAGGFGIQIIEHMSIVSMYPYRKQFLKRLTGNVGGGFSYTQANTLAKFDFNGDVKYHAEKNIINLSYDANWSNQAELDATQRQYASANFYRLLKSRFFYSALLSGEKNSELELDLRTNIGLSFGNNVIYNNHSIAYGALGAQVNREITADSVANNAEGIITLNYTLFRHSSPKIDLTLSSTVFPSLNDFERVRLDFNSKLRWEIFKDFYLKYTYYYTYDTKPLSIDANKKDWSGSFGFEYSFN